MKTRSSVKVALKPHKLRDGKFDSSLRDSSLDKPLTLAQFNKRIEQLTHEALNDPDVPLWWKRKKMKEILETKKIRKCENCGEPLHPEEIKHNDGWCFNCNCPENSYPYGY